MSLPAPAPRRHLHTRTIRCDGYLRDDGLWDIEAQIVDTKAYRYTEPFRGVREPGSAVHDMIVRLTVDSTMTVRDIAVSIEAHPYATCLEAVPAFQSLIGARIGKTWRRAVNDAVAGTKGCTHVRELLFPMATVAFQTVNGWPEDGEAPTSAPRSGKIDPSFLNGCKAWADDGMVVATLHPHLLRRKTPEGAAPSAGADTASEGN
jgi:hypothetical protein